MKYVYECIGTFFLVLTIGMTVLGPNGVGALAPLVIGTALVALVYAGAHLSGAHYNPAVSLAVFLRGKLAARDLFYYWIMQLVGASLAACVVVYLKGMPIYVPLTLDVSKAFIVEFLYTFALCFVVLNVATTKETAGNAYFGLAIGLTVLVGAYAVGAISGGAFNPAVAFAITLMKLTTLSNLWLFVVSNFLGAALAAYVVNLAHQEK